MCIRDRYAVHRKGFYQADDPGAASKRVQIMHRMHIQIMQIKHGRPDRQQASRNQQKRKPALRKLRQIPTHQQKRQGQKTPKHRDKQIVTDISTQAAFPGHILIKPQSGGKAVSAKGQQDNCCLLYTS